MGLFSQIWCFLEKNCDFSQITKIAKDLGKIMQTWSNLVQTFLRMSSKDLSTIFWIFWFFSSLCPILCKKMWFLVKNGIFHAKLHISRQKIKKMVDKSLELILRKVWSKFDLVCIIFPRSLAILVIFGKSRFCPKNIKFDKKALFITLFDLESGIFFLWSLNLIGILDFGKFGHLKANIPGFMAQKKPKNGHFLAQNGSDSRNLPGHNSRMGWNF